jgi:hypothetical protein
MRFGDWIKYEGLSLGAVARRLGLADASVVRHYAAGRVPRPEIVEKIYVESSGLVAPADWYDLPGPNPPAAAAAAPEAPRAQQSACAHC